MGRKPVPEEESDFISVGKREMLDALKSLLEVIDDKSIKEDEYYFRFTTANLDRQSGRCGRSSKQRSSYKTALELEICIEVESVFQAVEEGSLEERCYYFELTTPYFQFTSGEFPPKDNTGRSEHLPWSQRVYFPRFESVDERLLSRKRKLLEAESLPYGSIKRKTGTVNRICIVRLSIPIFLSALVVQTGASPIAETEHPLTLTAGKDGTIPFECSKDHQSDMPKYYTVTFEGKSRPFYLDGALDPEGMMSPDQAERFSVEYNESESAMSIEIHIASVSLQDQGTYIVMVIIPGEILEPRLMKQVVIIYIPPGPAACFLMPSESKIRPYEVHCHSKPGSGDSTLTCFQDNEKIPYLGVDDNSQIVYRREFWLMDASLPVSCCAHDIKEIKTISEALCNQFQWSQTRNPVQTEKLSTKKVLSTRPSSNDSGMQPPSLQTTVHSGCAQRFVIWSKDMLPLMAIVAFAVMSDL